MRGSDRGGEVVARGCGFVGTAETGCVLRAPGRAVGIVLRGIAGIRVGAEGAVDDGGRRICHHLTGQIVRAALDAHTAVPLAVAADGLDTHVAGLFLEAGMHEFGVVLVKDLSADERIILDLLCERAP